MTVIPIVQGNLLRLGIALQVVKITSVEGAVDKQVEDFVPNPNFPVRVLLTRDGIVCEFTATMEGNVAVIEDKGTVNVGKYALTVLCRDDDGNPMRFKQKDAVNIVDLTAEAGIVPGAEFETGTQWLDGAVFLSLTAQGGGGIGEETDPTVPQHVKAITQGNIDAWNAKQEAIGDLAQIRAGAAAGETALQPGSLDGYALSSSLAAVATSGSYNDLSNKPTIPAAQVQSDWNAVSGMGVILNKPTNLSEFTNDLETPSVTVSATGDVSQALNPNTFYRFGAVDSLDLTLVAGTGLVVYFGRFSTSANWGGTGLTVPSGVIEGANNPTVEASKTYEFNIMDNVLLLMEV